MISENDVKQPCWLSKLDFFKHLTVYCIMNYTFDFLVMVCLVLYQLYSKKKWVHILKQLSSSFMLP